MNVTNDLPAVAPTGFANRHMPYFLMLIISMVLLIGNGVAKRKKEQTEMVNTGSPGKNVKSKRTNGRGGGDAR